MSIELDAPPKTEKIINIAKKYPEYSDDIYKFQGEILKMYQLYTDLKREIAPENPKEMNEMMMAYAKSEKYNKFYAHFPPLFYVLFISKVFCVPAAIKYLNAYHEKPIDTKERYLEVCKTYFMHFDREILKKIKMKKKDFINEYMIEMEYLFDKIKESMEKKKALDELKQNEPKYKRDHLKNLLKKVDLEKIQQLREKESNND